MIAPSVPFAVWVLAAFDPALVIVACWLGWRADQRGKIFVAAIAAIGASLLLDWFLTAIGMPMLAPVSGRGPILLPVRSVAALAWAAGAYWLASRRRR